MFRKRSNTVSRFSQRMRIAISKMSDDVSELTLEVKKHRKETRKLTKELERLTELKEDLKEDLREIGRGN